MAYRLKLRLLACVSLCIAGFSGCRNHISINVPAAPPLIKDDNYFNGSSSGYAKSVERYNGAVDGGPAKVEEARQLRNDVTYNLMAEIDKVYGEYAVRLNAGKGAEAFGFDTLTLGLSTAATIATHAATKTLLSSLGTGITGVGQSFDKNYFSQQTFAVIAISMQTRRDKVRAVIVGNLSQDDVATYPLSAAKRDLVDYYYAGTLAGGLQELQEESGTATKQTTQVAATPVFSPSEGTYKSAEVAISTKTPNATIYYTLDGSIPTTSSSTYSGQIAVTATKTIEAVAVAPGVTNSAVAKATYTIQADAPEVGKPVEKQAPLSTPMMAPH